MEITILSLLITGKHPSESSGTLLMHLSESRARKNNVLFHKLQAAGIYVVTESLFGFTKRTSVGNSLVTGKCVIIHKSSKRNTLCHRNSDKRRHQKNTYLRIMENIHPNHNPLSKSLMLWSNTNANFRYYHILFIMHMWKQINNISWYCGNHDLISPDHGKTPIRIIRDFTDASFRIPCPKK